MSINYPEMDKSTYVGKSKARIVELFEVAD
jgi:hypothetical protein